MPIHNQKYHGTTVLILKTWKKSTSHVISPKKDSKNVSFSDDEPDEEVLAVVAELQQRWATQKRLAQESRLGANEQVHEMDMPHYAPELVAQSLRKIEVFWLNLVFSGQPEQFNDRLDLNVFLSANGGGTTPNPWADIHGAHLYPKSSINPIHRKKDNPINYWRIFMNYALFAFKIAFVSNILSPLCLSVLFPPIFMLFMLVTIFHKLFHGGETEGILFYMGVHGRNDACFTCKLWIELSFSNLLFTTTICTEGLPVPRARGTENITA